MQSENKKASYLKAGAGHLFFCVAAAAILCGCSSTLAARLSQGGSSLQSASFSLSLAPSAQRLAQAFLGQEAIFDAEKIEEAFAAIDFPSPASVSSKGGGELTLEFLAINLESGIFPMLEDGGTRAFDLDAGKKRLRVTLSREIVAKIVAALPNELFEYADLLMAPTLTGERMTEEEYIALIAAAYGPQAASDLKACSFLLRVQCPAMATAASARELSPSSLPAASTQAADVRFEREGSEARFIIPAAKLFTLYLPLQLEAAWE